MARIIIADDDPFFVDFVQATLAPLGHAIGALNDGDDVCSIVEAKRPDLLILDCGMPGKAGNVVLREIRKSSHDRIPVLMLTGRTSASDETLGYLAGADDYLRKPIDPERLIVHVEALLPAPLRRAG